MSDGFLSYRGAVYPWHCDHMGHMNVMWYVGKFDEATWNFFSEVGLTRALPGSEWPGHGRGRAGHQLQERIDGGRHGRRVFRR